MFSIKKLNSKRNYASSSPVCEPPPPKKETLKLLCHCFSASIDRGSLSFIHKVYLPSSTTYTFSFFAFSSIFFSFLLLLRYIGQLLFFFFALLLCFSLMLLLFFSIDKVSLLQSHRCFSFLLLMSDSLPSLFFFFCSATAGGALVQCRDLFSCGCVVVCS